jgi:stearoyl-CoA desaturase (delta-9 desaturase)
MLEMDTTNTAAIGQARGWRKTYFQWKSVAFWGLHVAAVYGIIALGFSWTGVAWAAAMYAARMFIVTAVNHRYFSHRTYRTSRWFQFVLAVAAQAIGQKGVVWWAGHHRRHHKFSDTELDVHSPYHGGFWWSHMGWMLGPDFEGTDESVVRDLARYPELRALEPLWFVIPVAIGVASFLVGGWFGLVWAFALPQVLSWHGTFTINSLSHVWGGRRYASGDDSRNNPVLAILTLGEGWHNNHHHYQASARQGFFWWEVDLTYYGLRLLQLVGLIWDVRGVPDHVRAGTRKAVEAAAVGAEAGPGADVAEA